MTLLRALNKAICNVTLYAAALSILVISIVIMAQVFFRYVLNNSLSWAEDVSLMLMVSSAFLVMPYALREGLHISVDVLLDLLPDRMRAAVALIIDLSICLLTVYAIMVSWRFAWSTSMMANAVPIRMSWVYAMMPVSFALSVPVVLERIIGRVRVLAGGKAQVQ
ncbi:MAG: TRAP transporter small permease [Roseovarius sp.]